MSSLMPVSEARARLLQSFAPVSTETVALDLAAGRVLSAPVVADFDLPPFSNSSMDGFAIRANDTTAAGEDRPVRLQVVGDIPAGAHPPGTIKTGEAARIMTGAPLPPGADAVAPVEMTDFNDRQPGSALPANVLVYQPIEPGAYVRPRGEDLLAGQVIFEPGHKLRPPDVGFCAMLGLAQVPVYRKPRVAILSTGDELVPVGKPLAAGQIHDSNTYTLNALVERYGSESLRLGIIPDQAAAVASALDRAAQQQVDLILSSAGVSVGAFDFVRTVVAHNGKLDFWRVNMRPGKPLAFGSYRDIPFVGLPGNPVSSYVGFLVFVQPALARLAGLPDGLPAYRKATLQEPVHSDGRESYLRAIVTQQGSEYFAGLTGHQGSGNLHSLVLANALLFIPSGVKFLPIGADVDAWILDEQSVAHGS